MGLFLVECHSCQPSKMPIRCRHSQFLPFDPKSSPVFLASIYSTNLNNKEKKVKFPLIGKTFFLLQFAALTRSTSTFTFIFWVTGIFIFFPLTCGKFKSTDMDFLHQTLFDRMKTVEWQTSQKLKNEREIELRKCQEQLSSNINSVNKPDLQRHVTLLTRQREIDNEETLRIERGDKAII